MSDEAQEKFRGELRRDERFLNISSAKNTFKLIARDSFAPVYKGGSRGGMVLGQHAKFFFKIRQKTTNGLMAFCDKKRRAGFMAPKYWRFALVVGASLAGEPVTTK
ncbi:hypothetical protein P5705_04150 [Pseudomonas entomophila]|uniref:hypothetical protein n=1 Tax=Pseudomonas entomophila TaxID=312306 RepID=UPI0024062563|nr:hypothetical protein [Pseudomonas entomophila]MDF9616826.1 hypothetical protein [Pseudomonas entomophila]